MHGGQGAALVAVSVLLAFCRGDKCAVNFLLVRGTVMPPRRERQPRGDVRGSPQNVFR